MIQIKRVYDRPRREDGRRVFIDRLWPRGIQKENLPFEQWNKEVAPSPALRRWFGHRPEKFDEFRKRYVAELEARPEAWRPLVEAARRGTVTLLYSAHDTEHNGAVVLRDFLRRRARGGAAGKTTRKPARNRPRKKTKATRKTPLPKAPRERLRDRTRERKRLRRR